MSQTPPDTLWTKTFGGSYEYVPANLSNKLQMVDIQMNGALNTLVLDLMEEDHFYLIKR